MSSLRGRCWRSGAPMREWSRSSFGSTRRFADALRGLRTFCASGQGLWAGDNQRYRVGQRLLMLLHAPSAAGMSSPVGGLDGAIPIRQGGAAPSQADDTAAAQPPYVDLRWLGVRVPHAVSYGSETAHTAKAADLSTPFLARQTAISKDASGSVASAVPIGTMPGNASSSGASVPAQQASVIAVMGLLTSWQRAQHAAP